MSFERTLRFDAVSKRYRQRDERRSLRSLLFSRDRRPNTTAFWALRDVTFQVPAGSSTGLIGGNGAGKSTLLRLASGLGPPTTGTIAVPRDTLSVLGLGASFDRTLSGSENALTALVVAGLSRRQASATLLAVREFAELGDFFDRPARTYSAGMALRLAFAVAVQLHADAFVVDEVLSVGDLRFQEKCTAHLKALRASGATILIASHDLEQVVSLCDEAVWLDAGRVRRSGPAADVAAAYRDAMRSRTLEVTPRPPDTDTESSLKLRQNRFGSQEITLEDVSVNLSDEARIEAGDSVRIDLRVQAGRRAREVVLGIGIRRAADDLELVKEHTELGIVDADRLVSIAIERLDLAPGEYRIDVGAYAADWTLAYDYHWGANGLTVGGTRRPGAAVLQPEVRWQTAGLARLPSPDQER